MLGCGGASGGDRLHSNLRASLPPPFKITGEAPSPNSARIGSLPPGWRGCMSLAFAPPCSPTVAGPRWSLLSADLEGCVR